MAARLGLAHDKKTRDKIRTSQLINRLHNHVFDKVELSATQLKAIEILLKKTLPDLQSISVEGMVEHQHTHLVATGEFINGILGDDLSIDHQHPVIKLIN